MRSARVTTSAIISIGERVIDEDAFKFAQSWEKEQSIKKLLKTDPIKNEKVHKSETLRRSKTNDESSPSIFYTVDSYQPFQMRREIQ